MADILVFGEVDRGELRPEFWELIAVASKLGGAADLRVAVMGAGLGSSVETARHAGARDVHIVDDERLGEPWPEVYAEAAAALCDELQPEIVLVPRTVLGVEVAARLSIRRGSTLLHDVTHVERYLGGVRAARPVFGGAVSATVESSQGPWVIVPRPHAFGAAVGGGDASEVVRVTVSIGASPKTRCGARTQQSAGADNIERARVLVAGGAGLGGPEPFGLLGEVATMLGGTVAASRVACDAGWVPTSIQVGLTGKTVAPDVYIAVGISGASQHLAGCSSAQVIVAINKDKSAPIFRIANFGVVGDWKDVIPAFLDALKARLAAPTSVA